MGVKDQIGIYFSDSANGHSGAVNFSDVIEYASHLPDVSIVWRPSDLKLYDVEHVAEIIKGNNINRIIVTGDSPGIAKNFFAHALSIAGVSPDNLMIASFREHGAITAADTDRAKAILASAVYGIPFEIACEPAEYDVNPDTLVIGGGIAGIQASLEIADANQKVYLVEKSPTIGGHMAMFDKTFPTLDCAACILTPKMVEVNQHPKIELLSYSEVKKVTGEPGNYKVRVLKKARHIDISTCIGCGTCAEKCATYTKSEFDSGTTMRKAIYIPFPQAVPNKYVIDEEACRYFTSGKCGLCAKFCLVENCIDLDAKDEEVEINVGNIIVATGFKTFDASRIEQFGYGKFPNVVTSIEFERLVNASGPTGGFIKFRTQDKKGNWVFEPGAEEPKSVALIHCVGSRDENYNKYCSRVCCMYSLKLAHLVKEKLPDADVFEYYIDMRAFGKGYEEFYNRIKDEGIKIIRGRTATIEERNNKLLLRSEDMQNDRLCEQEVDMVVLAVGLEPREDAKEMASMLGLQRGSEGWFKESNYNSGPVNTNLGGIHIAGACQGPKDIPDSVAQGSAAASRVLQSIMKGKIKGASDKISLDSMETKIKELSTIEEARK